MLTEPPGQSMRDAPAPEWGGDHLEVAPIRLDQTNRKIRKPLPRPASARGRGRFRHPLLALVVGLAGCLSVPPSLPVRSTPYRATTSLLGPLLLEQELRVTRSGSAIGEEPAVESRRETRLGPFGCLAILREAPGRHDLTLLSIPFLGVSLLDVSVRTDRSRARLGLVPFLPALSWDRERFSHRAGIGPAHLLLDVGWGPDRARFSLTPLLRYDRHGRSARVRLFFLDLYRSESTP